MADEPTAPWTILKLLDWTKRYLAKAQIDEPRLSAEVLLAHALGCERIGLYTRFDQQPPPSVLEAYRKMVKQAADHEPVAYLVGWREFYSLRFKVTRDVLVPRPETEQLVRQAVLHLKSLGRSGLMWDICTGSGCVAVATASQVPDLMVLATDISPAAVAMADENARALGVGSRVRCRVTDLASLGEDCADLKDFDVITANPPYVAQGDWVSASVAHEPPIALQAGKDGLDCIRRLVPQVGIHLRSGGRLAVEFGRGQTEAICDLLAATGQFDPPHILPDHQDIERTAVATRRCG